MKYPLHVTLCFAGEDGGKQKPVDPNCGEQTNGLKLSAGGCWLLNGCKNDLKI
jgi:hypothetical protein